ncbi:g5342 [Coccomyxa viridis]|uniref:G5342 protein n=1 Tax=Coccomyxa viridis TaxID=1274662 RepID=A0ABP1FTZ3_9CHLO
MAPSRSDLMLAAFVIAALAAVATAANAPVTSADLVTPGDQYPMPQGLDSWASVLADVFMQKEGSHDNAKSAVSSFQSLVSNQLAKMEKDFQAGKPFPDLPAIRDVKAFKGGLNFNPSNITAVSLSSTFFNYAPCLIQNSAAGAAFTAVGVNFVPQVINVAPKGAQILPIGIEINPAVILVNPQGLAVWPRAINVQPTLIAIVPADLQVAPQGVEIAPFGIAASNGK